MTKASAPAFNKAVARSNVSLVTPTAAATNKRPCSSLAAAGNSTTFSISLIVIKPVNSPASLTIGNFSILCCCKIASAFSKDVPSGAVIKLSLVITSPISIL